MTFLPRQESPSHRGVCQGRKAVSWSREARWLRPVLAVKGHRGQCIYLPASKDSCPGSHPSLPRPGMVLAPVSGSSFWKGIHRDPQPPSTQRFPRRESSQILWDRPLRPSPLPSRLCIVPLAVLFPDPITRKGDRKGPGRIVHHGSTIHSRSGKDPRPVRNR